MQHWLLQLEQLSGRFLQFMNDERSSSPHTIQSYRFDLVHWMAFLKEKAKPTQLDDLMHPDCYREFVALELKQFERSTVNRRVSAIKAFLKFLHREGWLKRNISKLIYLPKVPIHIPFVLQTEQIISLIEQASMQGTLANKRLRAVLEILYSTGIRVSEMKGLTISDIDFRKKAIRVMGKGSKERWVPMGQHCANALLNYIEAVPPFQKDLSCGYLFLNEDGLPVSVRTLQRIVQRHAIEVLGPIGARVTPHTFRHSCATHLLERGAGLRQIQEFLGHESLLTTQKYTHLDSERLKSAHMAAHPRNKIREPDATK